MYRRFLIYKRTKFAVWKVLVPFLFFMAIGLVLSIVLQDAQDELEPAPLTLQELKGKEDPKYAIVFDEEQASDDQLSLVDKLSKGVASILEQDIGAKASELKYQNIESFNKAVYSAQKDSTGLNIVLGLEIGSDVSEENLSVTVLYNSTELANLSINYVVQLERILWSGFGYGKLNVRFVSLETEIAKLAMNMILPLFLITSLTGFVNLIAVATTDDVKSSRRPYLLTCNVDIKAYWIGCTVVDMCVWTALNLLGWIIYVAVGDNMFRDFMLYSLWQLLFIGMSIIWLIYALSFIFTDPETSGAVNTMIITLLGMIPYLIDMLRGDAGDGAVCWVYGLFPPANLFGSLAVLTKCGDLSFAEMWTHRQTSGFLVMTFVDIPIYFGIILLIEYIRQLLPKQEATKAYEATQEVFRVIKNRQPITEEAKQAGEEADNAAPGDFAIRASHVFRGFFDTNNTTIAAVNDVSLGIKHGALFGFLGANGAGKTTLMKMITGELPICAGTIEVDGYDVSTSSVSRISMCPQFNDHLINEMTVEEHLKFFIDIFGLDQEQGRSLAEGFIQELELEEHKAKAVRELSGGNARKLALAISLLSPANIVLLDEPTSSLDPIVRHTVHSLINRWRGQKTFMLCTHLLGEAESLCDTISIMIKGSIFVVGTPQYLSSKFGTEWRVDVLMDNDEAATVQSVSNFMETNVPYAHAISNRGKSMTYSIPSQSVEIAPLFRIMKNGVEQNIGIKHFTCSSSTLEKVFLELIMQSEEVDLEPAGNVNVI